MKNISRTTLRELKKRYLNVLKKCFLANLMAFGMVTLATPATGEDRLENYDDKTYTSDVTFEYLVYNDFGGAIYNDSTITFGGDATFTGNSADFGGAIYNEYGVIKFGSDTTATFTGNSADFGGAIYNEYGAITFDKNSIALFDGNNSACGGGAIYNNGTITFGESSTVTFTGNSISSSGGAIENIGTITFGSDTTATFTGNSASSSGGAIYNYTGIITFGGDATFEGNKSSATGGHSRGGAIYNMRSITFDALATFEGNSATATGGHSYGGAINNGVNTVLTFNDEAQFKNNTATATALEKAGGTLVGGNSYGGAIYNSGAITFNDNFLFSGNTVTGTNAKGADIYNSSYATINFAHGEGKVGTLDGGIYQSGSSAKINKTGTGTLILGDNMVNGYSTGYTSQFNQSAGLTIAHADKLNFATTNTITGGELKTHGAEIAYKATLGETGTLTHLGTSADTPTEIKGITFNGTGLNLTLGTYTKAEQEKEITLVGDRFVEYVDDKGTEDTADDELVSYQATDKLFTVKALENDQKAKFILNENLTGMEGNSITVAGAELDVKEGLKVAGKVVSKGMILGNEEEYSFTELEIAEGTTLDIDNKHVSADKVVFGNESTLSVTLNELADYGTLSHDEVVGDENAKLNLKLTNGIDTELGIYQVFNKDNDLTLLDNNLLDIIDMGDGSYRVRKKADAILEADLGMSKAEVSTVTALLKEAEDGTNSTFLKAQEEILEGLQSENKGTVMKAKKALNALGARSTSIYQSQATAQFTQMHTVITQMLMNSTAPIFGHAGDEEPARATVYVKGLYDRVNSLAGDGFRMRSKGAVLGVQSAITEDLTVGIGYAGINTIAKEPLRRTEVDTNTGFISAQYQPNNWWVNGVLTYSRSQYDEEKNILSTKGIAKYDVDSLGAQITTGYNIKRGDWIVTPEVGVRYLNARQEGYTDSLGTTVEKTTSDFVTTMAGFKVGVDLGWMRPLAGVMVGYDVVTDDISAVNTLASGTTYTIKGKALDRLSTTVVAGFAADIADNATLKLEYSGNYRKEYLDHSGMLRLEWRF